MTKKLISAITVILFTTGNLFAQYTGRVYVDINGNGQYDQNEKGVKDVVVSDGLNVTNTNAYGIFKLPGHKRERFIFITTPSGYQTSHTHYKAIDKQNRTYNFGLKRLEGRIAQNGSHKFIQLTDTEIFNTKDHEDWIGDIRDYGMNEQVAFIIHTGDICYENGLKNHIKLMNSNNMGYPVFYCIGNHDLIKGKYGEELFESIYGPVYYSFDFGNVHYIVTPMASGDYKPGYTKEDVYKWLKNDLAYLPKGKPVIVFNHDLLTSSDKFIFGVTDKDYINLNDYNLKAWLYGHWHNQFMRKQGDVYTISTATPDKGGIDHSTSAFRVVSVNESGNVSTDLRYTYMKPHIQIASIQNNTVATTANNTVPLSVNTYNSASPTKSVTYSCTVGNKIILKDKPLIQNTDWSWHTEIPVQSIFHQNQIFVQVRVEFHNSESVVATESFAYPTPGKIDSDQEMPVLKWISNIKGNIFFSSPIICNNTIYVATVDEDLKGQGGISALNIKTGEIKWRYQTRNSIKNTIATDGEYIFAQDAEGYLYAVNANSGLPEWEKKMGVAGLPVLDDGLTVSNGILYAGSGKGFGAYDCKTGEIIWLNKEWDQNEGTTSTVCVSENTVITGNQWRGLYGHDRQTGKLRWTLKDDGLSNRASTPAIQGSEMYIVSGKSLFLIHTDTGKVINRKEYPINLDVSTTPLITDKLIMFGSADKGLIAVDRKTYDIAWIAETRPALIYTAPYTRYPVQTVETSPVVWKGIVYFGASDGTLYGVNPDNGTTVFKYKTGSPFFASSLIMNNMLFVVDFSGNVYAFH